MRERVGYSARRALSRFVIAGLDPAIHVLVSTRKKVVDGRNKSGHDDGKRQARTSGQRQWNSKHWANLEEILEVAKRAPSSMNTKPWHVHVLTGEPLEKV